MKIVRRVLIGLLIVSIVGILGFVIWAVNPLEATPEALAVLESDSKVTVTEGDYITFMPAGSKPITALVFYPGGRVDYRAYAVPLRRIAEQGYLVILLPVRLNLAFFEINAADRAIPDFPEIETWVVGGHSLGGVAASMYAAGNESLDGVIYWASYPADDSLKNTDLEILSTYGTLDMSGKEPFEASRADLPADANFVVIEGGNHSQFGNYGLQPGDNAATISRQDQQTLAVEATVQLLDSLSK